MVCEKINYYSMPFPILIKKISISLHITAHKVILAARSDYFRAMLYGGLSESTKDEIVLQVNKDAFKILLKYIYCGRLSLRKMHTPQMNLILDTLGLANLFGYVELKDEISNFLKNSLKLDNVCNILDASRLYELNALTNICYLYIDKNAEELLNHESFKYLNHESLIMLLARDSFYVEEIMIFKAVQGWIECNTEFKPDVIKEVVSKVRLPLISTIDLLSTVRPTGILDPNTLLDAIEVREQSKVRRALPHRGRLYWEENIATSKYNARVIQGISDGFTVLDDSNHSYDMEKGYTRHAITSKNDDNGIIVELGNIYIINYIKILLWDLDNRSYSYVIDVSVEKDYWERVIDYSEYHCRSWQHLYFTNRPVKYIRIKGTHNTVNRVFHLVSMEAMCTNNVPTIVDQIIAPKYNCATVEKSATVIEGVSRNKNSLLNGNLRDYDWDTGYTCHQLGSGNILIQLGQPYLIGSFRVLLWDCDERCYGFYIETSVNESQWDLVVDRRNDRLQSWQSFTFEPRIITYIKIVGTFNSANEIFHIVHFECPGDEKEQQLQENKQQLSQ
jgi:BTB/POZ domain-containing protein 9